MLCFAAAWLLPNHYAPWFSFYSDSSSAIGLILLLGALFRRVLRSSPPLVAWLAILLAVLPAMQWASGLLPFSGDAVIAALYALGFAVAILVGAAWAQHDTIRATTTLAAATLVGAIASALIAVASALGLTFGAWVLDSWSAMRQYANLGQPNNLATLLGMGAVGVLALYERHRLSAGTSTLLVAVLVAGTVLTQSRTALLYGPVVMLLLAWYRKRGVPWRTRQSFVAATTLAVWLGAWMWPLLQQRLLLDVTTSLSERGGGSPRFKVWPILFDGLSQAPWGGFGWLQVGAAELAAAGRHQPVGELYLHAHDIFFELILWAGYPVGLLLSLAIVVWYVSRLARISTAAGAIGLMVVSIVGAHALVELPHHYAYFLLPVGLWIGILEQQIGMPRRIDGRWNLLPIGVAALLLAGIWRDYPAIEEDFRTVRFENLRIASEAGRSGVPAEAPFLSSLTAFLQFTRTPAHPGMTEAELDRMWAVVRRYPYAPAMMHMAEALALNGRFDEARALMVEIRHIHGEAMYQRILRDLHGRIDDGRAELISLERSLPR